MAGREPATGDRRLNFGYHSFACVGRMACDPFCGANELAVRLAPPTFEALPHCYRVARPPHVFGGSGLPLPSGSGTDRTMRHASVRLTLSVTNAAQQAVEA